MELEGRRGRRWVVAAAVVLALAVLVAGSYAWAVGLAGREKVALQARAQSAAQEISSAFGVSWTVEVRSDCSPQTPRWQTARLQVNGRLTAGVAETLVPPGCTLDEMSAADVKLVRPSEGRIQAILDSAGLHGAKAAITPFKQGYQQVTVSARKVAGFLFWRIPVAVTGAAFASVDPNAPDSPQGQVAALAPKVKGDVEGRIAAAAPEHTQSPNGGPAGSATVGVTGVIGTPPPPPTAQELFNPSFLTEACKPWCASGGGGK